MKNFPFQEIKHESDLDKDFGKLIAKNALAAFSVAIAVLHAR